MGIPKTLSSDIVYSGAIFDLRVDRVREDGNEYGREIVINRAAAAVLPMYEDGSILLVRQYRHAAEEYLLELPAGLIEAGESPEDGALRELREEACIRADSLGKLSEFYTSPGYATEKIHLYLATGLTETDQHLDPTELICVERMSIIDGFDLIKKGDIKDAKTIIGLILGGVRRGHVFRI